MLEAVRKFHTSKDGAVAEDDFRRFLDKVTSVSVDGCSAMKKTVALLKPRLKNLTLFWRDRAHAVRSGGGGGGHGVLEPRFVLLKRCQLDVVVEPAAVTLLLSMARACPISHGQGALLAKVLRCIALVGL